MEFGASIHSLYIIITEPKIDSQKIDIDHDQFKFSAVKGWWLNGRQKSYILHNPVIKSLASVTGVTDGKSTAATEKALRSTKTQIDVSSKEQIDRNKETIQLQNIFPSVIEDDNSASTPNSESYIDHLMDVVRDAPDHFIEEEKTNIQSESLLANCMAKEMPVEVNEWWQQNLILLVEIIDANIGVRKYKGGRIVTEVKNLNFLS